MIEVAVIVVLLTIPIGAILAKRHIQSKLSKRQEAKKDALRSYRVDEDTTASELLHIVYKAREAKMISGKKHKEISHMVATEGPTSKTRELVRQILPGRDDQVPSGEPRGNSGWVIVAALIPLMVAVSFATIDRPNLNWLGGAPKETMPPSNNKKKRDFHVTNFSHNLEADGTTNFIGEIHNINEEFFEMACFTLSIYDSSGKLLSVEAFIVSNFEPLSVRSFSTYSLKKFPSNITCRVGLYSSY